jgi:hypothetical protein
MFASRRLFRVNPAYLRGQGLWQTEYWNSYLAFIVLHPTPFCLTGTGANRCRDGCELLKEAIQELSRVAVLWNPSNPAIVTPGVMRVEASHLD